MTYKKVLLLIVAICSIVLYFCIPFYNYWLYLRILNPNTSIIEQAKHLDIEDRKTHRYGSSYINYMQLVKIIENAHVRDPVLLLPPNEYLRSVKVTDFECIEPAEFYYFTNMKAVWTNSPDVMQANLALEPNGEHKLQVKRILNLQQLDRLLVLYKPYTSKL